MGMKEGDGKQVEEVELVLSEEGEVEVFIGVNEGKQNFFVGLEKELFFNVFGFLEGTVEVYRLDIGEFI